MNQELVQATTRNHISWFTQNALMAGGETTYENGVTGIHSPSSNPKESGEIILAFPHQDMASARVAVESALILARQKRVRQVSCWSVLPTEPPDLAAMLLALGFGWGWQPHWMSLDLEKASLVQPSLPDGLEIALDDQSDWDVTDLPYYDRTDAQRLQAHAAQTPRRTYHFAARLNGRVVGHSLLHIDPLRVAGLYNVSVVPSARNQGIGRAISLAACEYARTLGCRYVLLNAATHIYTKLGFVSLGYGQTWWMFSSVLNAPPPPASTIDFTLAIGRGDIASLAKTCDLDAPLPCKMTPLEVAAKLRQPEVAQWLLDAGASPEIIPLYDMGWQSRLPDILKKHPALANHRFGEWGMTSVHEAVYRNDIRLLKLLLTATPNLEIKDTQFQSTPLGWAKHFGYSEMVALLESHK
jgi:GNAT superfamily N-acetyltransferase